jgi:hypothetical protein
LPEYEVSTNPAFSIKALLEQEEKPTWVTCRFFERSVDNIPRFPVVIDWGVGERND